ncbi:hypothetical protein BDP55DRAFT_734691 [Colletotrichum godetiae]|uniref:Uncharacterized protein n=1 Tax=Colletotrichum godetiae TaxID=1209918 RepID=A0AAJ0EQK6_9PEZI|nr:uncharacterized protein BDP55DRAFT_734691 [Colletotrichum godetiae]KAK1657679.1 hypothetical protein BDP55DRAFT_734691 [Colletotrichum godetiae]
MYSSKVGVLALLQAGLTCASAISPSWNVNIKRKAETNATLYAYGTNSSSWPVAYGLDDGYLYITQTPDDANANLAPITWDLPSITGENWKVNATFVNGTSAGSLTISDSDDNAMGLTQTPKAVTVNQTTYGWALFATQLVYNNNSQLEAQFWAKPSEWEDTYLLFWNADQLVSDGSFPVVVKGVENS